MIRLLAGFVLTALLVAGAPSFRLSEEGGRQVWIAEGCAPEAFAVFVDSLDGAPPLAGSSTVRDGAVVFAPRFPPSPGVSYRAECRNSGEPPATAVFTIPAGDQSPTTAVEAVYPSADKLPENLLKFYVHFSAPMSKGYAYERVRLLDAIGEAVELAFLEIDEELWDASYQRLTLLFDPGRIKSGLVPNQEVGIALRPGESYTLQIDAEWQDAQGKRLKAPFEKRFSVAPADVEPPSPETWKLTAPTGGSEAVALDFPEPLDQALLSRVVSVVTLAGNPTSGRAEISRGETRWTFTPDAPWARGRYRIEVLTILEDLAGNSVNRPFEVDVFEKVEERVARHAVSIPFAVGLE